MREPQARNLISKRSLFLVSKRCPRAQLRRISTLSGVKVGAWPFKYLGVYLFKGRKKKVYFQHILDLVNKKLAGWTGKFLSFNAD